ALHHPREVAAGCGPRGKERLDGPAVEALGHPRGEADELAAIGLGLAALQDDLGHAGLARRMLRGHAPPEEIQDLVHALRPSGQQQVAGYERLTVRTLALPQRALAPALLTAGGTRGGLGLGCGLAGSERPRSRGPLARGRGALSRRGRKRRGLGGRLGLGLWSGRGRSRRGL